MTSKAVYLFPGQGAEYYKMGKDLIENYAEIARMIHLLSYILDTDLTRLLTQANHIQLNRSRNAQLATFSLGIAISEFLKNNGIKADIVTGHGVGLITAICAAEALPLNESAKLVSLRGKLCSKVAKRNQGCMAVILGIQKEVIKELCTAQNKGYVTIGAYNAPTQLLISGDKKAVAAVANSAKDLGAHNVIQFPVQAAFHSDHMSDIENEFQSYLKKLKFQAPSIPVIANSTAKYLLTPRAIKKELMTSLSKPIQWTDIVRQCEKEDMTHYIEVGPGDVLTKLLPWIGISASSFCTQSAQALRHVLSELSNTNHAYWVQSAKSAA